MQTLFLLADVQLLDLQGDTSAILMPLVNRLVLGLIISSAILGVSRVASAYLSRKP